VHFRNVHVVGTETRLRVRSLRGEMSDVALRLLDRAMREAADHAGGDADGAPAIRADPLQSFSLQTMARRRRPTRGAHRQCHRIRDRRRCEHLLHGEGFLNWEYGLCTECW